MASARKRAGLGHGTCHELRHTCLTRLREAGMSLEALQAQAGHRSIASTQVYLHLGADWLAAEYRAAAEAVEADLVREALDERRVRLQSGRSGRLGWPRGVLEGAPTEHRGVDVGRDRRLGAAVGLDNEGLPGPDRRFVPAEHCRGCRSRAADLRRPRSRNRPRVRLRGRHRTPPHRVFQARLGGPTRQESRPAAAVGTVRHKLGMLRTFFERIIDWDYPDAPRKVPIFPGDFPKADEPLPRFLDDPTATKFMAAFAKDPNQRRRLIVELLARTGMRVGELGALRDDAMFRLSGIFWLRIPVGKLHNDRTVPLHPVLVELIDDYRVRRGPSPSGLLVVRDDGQPFDRRTIHRYVAAVAQRAGTGHVHPHQLRHTLATQ